MSKYSSNRAVVQADREMMAFRIQKILGHYRWQIQELAKHSGLSRSQLSRWINKHSNMSKKPRDVINAMYSEIS